MHIPSSLCLVCTFLSSNVAALFIYFISPFLSLSSAFQSIFSIFEVIWFHKWLRTSETFLLLFSISSAFLFQQKYAETLSVLTMSIIITFPADAM
jgi:hypothetical protein